MPLATPASILSSADRRSWRAPGWSVTVADPASAVVVFMLQGCPPRKPPSIGIRPGSYPGVHPEGIGVIPDPALPAGRFGRKVRAAGRSARPAAPLWPQDGGRECPGSRGQGDGDGGWEVLADNPPQRESSALSEHDPRPGQGERAVPQGRWSGVDKQAVDPGVPGAAEPGECQQPHG